MSEEPAPTYKLPGVATALTELYRQDAMYRLGSQQKLAEEAMKALLFVNGGAMVALFTLVGAVTSKGFPLVVNARLLWLAFAAFTLGLFVTLVTYLLGFLSQATFLDVAQQEMVNNARMAEGAEAAFDTSAVAAHGMKIWTWAIVAAVSSAILFVVGAALSLAGFLPA